VGTGQDAHDPRFNGATPFQAWKRILVCIRTGRYAPLQWGHAFSGVETRQFGSVEHGAVLLQWGHAFSGVETRQKTVRILEHFDASMGPRLFRRGNRPHQISLSARSGRLQWGHAFSGVETLPMAVLNA